MNLGVIGTRRYSNYAVFRNEMDKIHAAEPITKIVCDDSAGVGALAKQYAEERKLSRTTFPLDYDKHNHLAPYHRNKEIINASEMILFFWDGKSPVTKDAIQVAKTAIHPRKKNQIIDI